jgi:hypothetical protein
VRGEADSSRRRERPGEKYAVALFRSARPGQPRYFSPSRSALSIVSSQSAPWLVLAELDSGCPHGSCSKRKDVSGHHSPKLCSFFHGEQDCFGMQERPGGGHLVRHKAMPGIAEVLLDIADVGFLPRQPD